MHDQSDHLLVLACRTAARVIQNPVLAEEAGERAVFRYRLAVLRGAEPDQPEAWIRTVARRSAFAILRNGWARTQPLPEDDLAPEPHPAPCRQATREALRTALTGVLTARQRQALEAALTTRTVREAARACAMEPRDFRRYLAAIARHARTQLMVAEPGARWQVHHHAG